MAYKRGIIVPAKPLTPTQKRLMEQATAFRQLEAEAARIAAKKPTALTPEQKRLITQATAFREAEARAARPAIKPSEAPSKPEAIVEGLPTGITLRLSDAERQKLAALRAQATCAADRQKYEPRLYKATLRDGGYVFVEETTKRGAWQKAEDAGYRIGRVVTYVEARIPTPAKPKTTTTPGATVSVKDGATGDTIVFPKASWDAWPEKYRRMVKSEGWKVAMWEFRRDYVELPDNLCIEMKTWQSLPRKYQLIANEKGWQAMQNAFTADHVELGDGKWIANDDWDKIVESDRSLGTDFADIGKKEGYDAMAAAIDEANRPYQDFLKKVERGDIIPVAGDRYITKEDYSNLPTGAQRIIKEQGFEALEAATTITWVKGAKPVGVSWDPVFKKRLTAWESLPDTLTQKEFEKVPFAQKDFYRLSDKSLPRAGGLALASFIPPAKGVLPEYTMADITAYDWGIAAAQAPLIAFGLAPGAISSSIVGKVIVTGASGALSGLIGYSTAKNWANLTPEQRAMGVGMTALCAIPIITTVARNVKISGPAIPTTKGNVVVWKGLSVAGHPIIGRSGGKWVLGTRSITLPEARLILNGYKPEMMLETKVFVNRSALQKAGLSKAQIDYLTTSLKSRNLFAGKASPWLDKNVLIEPTQRLNANEISIIMQRLARLDRAKAGALKDAHLLYGSSTIKSQLAPKLRNWRPVHDWDISLNMNQSQTQAFTHTLLKDLQSKGGGTYRVSPQSTTLIEKKVGGTWTHIVDIHSQQVAITSAMDIPTSKLDATGTYSYGRMVSEPAITVKYPGVGKLRIMRLSESGVRKADTILRVRQTPEGTAFRPPQRGIAQPGVPKDAADFYVTVRTFCGEQVAEEWLESWARAMGYSKPQLRNVLPKIRRAMLDVAAQTPSSIIGYEFLPASSTKVVSSASPSIVVHIPSSLGASVSPKLEGKISQPIYPYKLTQSPSVQTATSVALASVISKSPKLMASLARTSPVPSLIKISGQISPKPSPSPAISKVPSPSPRPSASPVPSIAPSGKPSPPSRPSRAPSAVPSPKPSPIPSPKPSPYPTPSPKPSPYPYPYPKPGPKPKPSPKMPISQVRQKPRREGPALATWKQGMYWVSIFPPFRTTGTKPDVVYSRTKPQYAGAIAKGRRAPMKTLRAFGRIPPVIDVPMGVVTARIRNGRKLTFSRRRRGRFLMP